MAALITHAAAGMPYVALEILDLIGTVGVIAQAALRPCLPELCLYLGHLLGLDSKLVRASTVKNIAFR